MFAMDKPFAAARFLRRNQQQYFLFDWPLGLVRWPDDDGGGASGRHLLGG